MDGNRLYMARPNWLGIRDVTNPAAPIDLSVFLLDGRPTAIDTSGGFIYVALGERGVQIIDVSTITAPVGVHSIAGGYAEDLAVANNKLYITWNGTLRVHDVTTPSAPGPATTYAPAGTFFTQVESRGDIAFVSDDNELHAVDFATLVAPVLRDTLGLGASIDGMDLRPGQIALRDATIGLAFVDVGNPNNLTVASSWIVPGLLTRTNLVEFGQVSGTPVVFYTNALGSLDALSLATFTAPAPLSSFPSFLPRTVAADNSGNIFLGESDVLRTYQASLTGAHAFVRADVSPIFSPAALGIINDHLVVVETDTLAAYDVTNPEAPLLVSTLPLGPLYVSDAVVTDQVVAIVDSEDVIFYNLSSIAAPAQTETLVAPDSASDIAAYGSFVYVLGDRLKIFDVSNPADPFSPGSVNTSNSNFYVTAGESGVFAWDVFDNDPIECIDVSDPTAPFVASTLLPPVGENFSDAVTYEDYLIVLQSTDRVRIFDASNIASLAQVASFNVPTSFAELSVVGSHLIISYYDEPLADVIDIADPSNPILLPQKLRTAGAASDAATRGTTAWLSYDFKGIDTFRMPGQPRLAAPVADAPACLGGTSRLRVELADTTGATYRWRKNGVNLNNGLNAAGTLVSGVFSSTLTLTNTHAGDIGSYDCVITNACGSTTTDDAQLFLGSAPVIISQPQSAEVCPQGSVTLTMGWLGSQPATFQWQIESPANSGTFVNLADVNAPRFTRRGTDTRSMTIAAKLGETLPPAFVASRYRCIVTNACASATSQPALVTIGQCDCIDFNNNTVYPEDQDVIDFFNVLAGAECATCNDIDFNNNAVFPEDQDVITFFTVLAGGPCS
ncbi:MAG TPA: hypothetical protein VK157_04655 [Phycisphaerales bacterium]|nr:hypothetical protein [Phycisphaerales bacterium]